MNRRDFHTDYADELAGITEGGEMKTADDYQRLLEHIYDLLEHGENQAAQLTLKTMELSAYRAGMEAAAMICKTLGDSEKTHYSYLYNAAHSIFAAAKTAQLP